MATTYPIGTKISAIRNFDRSKKVFFTCEKHGGAIYASKQPSCSTWFFMNAMEPDTQECECSARADVWVTVEKYSA